MRSFPFFLINFYWNIVDTEYCVSFCCTEKWISYTYTYITLFRFLFFFPYRSLQSIEKTFCAIQYVSHTLDSREITSYLENFLQPEASRNRNRVIVQNGTLHYHSFYIMVFYIQDEELENERLTLVCLIQSVPELKSESQCVQLNSPHDIQ